MRYGHPVDFLEEVDQFQHGDGFSGSDIEDFVTFFGFTLYHTVNGHYVGTGQVDQSM